MARPWACHCATPGAVNCPVEGRPWPGWPRLTSRTGILSFGNARSKSPAMWIIPSADPAERAAHMVLRRALRLRWSMNWTPHCGILERLSRRKQGYQCLRPPARGRREARCGCWPLRGRSAASRRNSWPKACSLMRDCGRAGITARPHRQPEAVGKTPAASRSGEGARHPGAIAAVSRPADETATYVGSMPFSIASGPMSLAAAMERAPELLAATAEAVARVWHAGRREAGPM